VLASPRNNTLKSFVMQRILKRKIIGLPWADYLPLETGAKGITAIISEVKHSCFLLLDIV